MTEPRATQPAGLLALQSPVFGLLFAWPSHRGSAMPAESELSFNRSRLCRAPRPIFVFAHLPLWTIHREWGWGTKDGSKRAYAVGSFRQMLTSDQPQISNPECRA